MKGKIRRGLEVTGVLPSIHAMMAPFKTLEFMAVKRALNLRADDHLLDVGCGDGTQTMILSKLCRSAHGIEPNERAVVSAMYTANRTRNKKVSFSVGVATGAKPTGYTAASMICVLEHISHPAEALRSVRDSLLPDGRLVLTADALAGISQESRERHTLDHAIVNYFTARDLWTLLDSCGYRDIAVHQLFCSRYAKRLFGDMIWSSFKVGPVRYWPTLARLAHAERRTGVDGLFLLATAVRGGEE